MRNTDVDKTSHCITEFANNSRPWSIALGQGNPLKMVPWKSASGYFSGTEVQILIYGSNLSWRDMYSIHKTNQSSLAFISSAFCNEKIKNTYYTYHSMSITTKLLLNFDHYTVIGTQQYTYRQKRYSNYRVNRVHFLMRFSTWNLQICK